MSLTLPFENLSAWQQTAFSAALLERMLPNYRMFSEAADFGDFNVLRNQLNLIWQRLEQGQIKINFAVQLEKLEEVIPDVEDFDFFGVYPALDTCMALGSLLQAIQDKDDETMANVSTLSTSSVRYYLEILLASEHESEQEIIIQESDIDEHPLMAWEVASQQELFDAAAKGKANKQTCQLLKQLALSEGLSNLGIEV
ncbi:YjaG family protein [Thalassotalea crassostreae]|uniref:YjaG family protein n=1 Tax=Thalassotalea crassostreae TaxID=1763536 RepID=UPI000837B221|nr:YjaG family protein [Thalassotalea crassostreae]